MQFLYHKESGSPHITIEGEEYKYLFRVRRKKVESLIETRNLQDETLYIYRVKSIDKKEALLELVSSEVKSVGAKRALHIGWCIIDPKVLEKMLPSLNEIGVTKITFIKCAYSQANFKIKKERLEKILINSCQQCGRSSLMQIEFAGSVAEFVANNPQSYLLDFSERALDCSADIATIVVGFEGGVSEDERKLFKSERVVGFTTPLILRSESAAVAVGSKLLL
ncbi:MAG TPA: 16S rRNA (uracil(1498)-N(3))-methyltransferase [Nitratifractor sp.]|nr:16S rRNA (uracil(1498)-N(3))-methyltransferase [Nitratifractor sp.]